MEDAGQENKVVDQGSLCLINRLHTSGSLFGIWNTFSHGNPIINRRRGLELFLFVFPQNSIKFIMMLKYVVGRVALRSKVPGRGAGPAS